MRHRVEGLLGDDEGALAALGEHGSLQVALSREEILELDASRRQRRLLCLLLWFRVSIFGFRALRPGNKVWVPGPFCADSWSDSGVWG